MPTIGGRVAGASGTGALMNRSREKMIKQGMASCMDGIMQ
jgi:hypothetical protein